MSGGAPTPARPAPLRASRWVALAGALVLAGGTALLFTEQGRLAQRLRAVSGDAGYSARQAQSAAASFSWTLFIVSLLLGGLMCWFLWRTASGRRGFRTAATAVFVLTIVFAFLTGYLQVVAAVILLAAVVLQYAPSSNSYFREGPYGR